MGAFVCSQIGDLPRQMQMRGHVASWYRSNLADADGITCIEKGEFDAPWVFGIQTKDRKTRDDLREHLAACGIETRNYFYPLHIEPVNCLRATRSTKYPCHKLSICRR